MKRKNLTVSNSSYWTVASPAEGKTRRTAKFTEYEALVQNGFPGQQTNKGGYWYYRSLLDYFASTKQYRGLGWAKEHKEEIIEQYDLNYLKTSRRR